MPAVKDSKPSPGAAALYVRVSTQEQAEGESLATQESRLKAYCEAHGYGAFRVYSDPGYSAKDTNRPGLMALMEDIKKGQLHAVLVTRIDRITRSLRDLFKLVDFFEENRVHFISISQNIDTSTSMGRFTRDLFALLARLEREQVAERVASHMHHRASMGKWNGGNAPYGYTTFGTELSRLLKAGIPEAKAREKALEIAPEPKKLCVNPSEAEVVRRIFETFVQVRSIRRTVDTLNSLGVKSRTGKKWAVATVHSILNSPVCMGKISYGKTRTDLESGKLLDVSPGEWKVVQGQHESIIDEKLFSKAQEVLKDIRRKPTRASHSYLLSGLVRCGKCGGSMHGKASLKRSSGKEYRYYKCQNNETKGPSVCKGLAFPADHVDDFVVKTLMDLYKDKPFLQHKAKALEAMRELLKPDRKRSDMEKLKKEERSLDRQVEKLMEGWESGLFKREDFSREYEKLQAQLKENRTRLERLADGVETGETTYEALHASYEEIASFGKNWEYLDDFGKAAKVASVVKDITASEDGNFHFRLFVEDVSMAPSHR